MAGYKDRLKAVGAAVPELLLPAVADMTKYSVVACDQFSARPEYWQRVEDFVGDAPSTLRMVLPEARLATDRGEGIPAAMQGYLDSGVLRSIGETFVFLRRQTSSGVRRGLVVALDLEQYGYDPGWQGLIRATEGTVKERLPARVAIRRHAPLELPHIMVLIDDRESLLMGAMDAEWESLPKLYDFELMENGGHISGRRVDTPELLDKAAGILERLKQKSGGMLYAMGDGNHSFAAAKACWEEIKAGLTPEQMENHPARYSIVELVNLYDPALKFEPIHRLLMNVDADAVQREAGFDAADPPPLQELQPLLDGWLAAHPEAELEYIHGEQECRELGGRDGNLAIVLPPFDKESLFENVRRDGVLVRKSFSMGEARDKRYYLEAKKIK